MADKFVSPCSLPTDYEREILTILIEECAEVQQRATKLLRFGRDEVQPGQKFTNAERLSHEIGDMECVLDMSAEAGLIDKTIINVYALQKYEKVLKYLQSTPPQPE